MEIGDFKQKIQKWVSKYKYALLVFCIGLLLMLLPEKAKSNTLVPEETPTVETTQSTEDQLANILSRIDGAGEVAVFLSVAYGEETFFQTDEDTSVSENTSDVQKKTVIVSYDSVESGLVRQINPPTYKGALILCQGADHPQIQLAIVDAVSKVTGLGADKIAVLKMK